MNLRNFQMILLALNVLIIGASVAMPTANNDDSVTLSDEVTPYPFTQRRFVDLSFVSPEVSSMLQKSNLNIEQIRQQQDRLRNRYETITSSTALPNIVSDNDEDYRVAKIQSELQATLRDPTLRDKNIPSFEYAFPAVCEMPRYMNYSDWFGQKSWNIIFKPIYRHFNVQSSILRIYKLSKDEFESSSNECGEDVNDLFTIKVSVFARKKSKEFTKKAIHESLIPSKRTGWIEVDVFSTLKFWNNPRNNYGISIDLIDEQNQQLDAREYFALQNCADEAVPILPWRAYEFLAQQHTQDQSEQSALAVEQYRKMYTSPRLDVVSQTPANYNAHYSSSEEQAEQSRRSTNRSQRHIRHSHHSSQNEHRAVINKLVASLKGKSHKRRGHTSRDGTAGDT